MPEREGTIVFSLPESSFTLYLRAFWPAALWFPYQRYNLKAIHNSL